MGAEHDAIPQGLAAQLQRGKQSGTAGHGDSCTGSATAKRQSTHVSSLVCTQNRRVHFLWFFRGASVVTRFSHNSARIVQKCKAPPDHRRRFGSWIKSLCRSVERRHPARVSLTTKKLPPPQSPASGGAARGFHPAKGRPCSPRFAVHLDHARPQLPCKPIAARAIQRLYIIR